MIEMLLGGNLIPPLPSGNIKKFQTGASSIGALSQTGNLYTIGDLYSSGTGSSTAKWGLVAAGIEDFWMGFRTVLMKTKDGRWLFMGVNTFLPTSLPNTVLTPTDISSVFVIPDGYVIKRITVGYLAIGVVFTNGRYAMMGSNNSGGLGSGVAGPVRTLTLRTDFTDVAKLEVDYGSQDTSYLMRSNGMVYGGGSSTYGQLGQVGGNVATWKALATPEAATQMRDIVAGAQGIFFIQETDTSYVISSQGRQYSGSIGTGETGSVSVSTTTPVATITSKAGGPPTLYAGIYSARYQDPNTKTIYYTGIGSGNMAGGGPSFTGAKYEFTPMPVVTLWGEYFSTRQAYEGAYILRDGVVYGSGDAGALLPGITGSALSFTPLDVTPVT